MKQELNLKHGTDIVLSSITG